jgi:hypothetical protein
LAAYKLEPSLDVLFRTTGLFGLDVVLELHETRSANHCWLQEMHGKTAAAWSLIAFRQPTIALPLPQHFRTNLQRRLQPKTFAKTDPIPVMSKTCSRSNSNIP